MTEGTKWQPGTAYGPVLSQTDLYLLNPKVELHPIMTHSAKGFHLNFNLASGQTGGFNADNPDREIPFAVKDEVATLPRMSELIIITAATPWCTIIKNDHGVSMADICGALWREYTDNFVTEGEFSALPPIMQDRVKRTAVTREMGGMMGHYPSVANFPINRIRRIDWIRERVFFNGLERDDDFARKRLGFAAPNIFVLHLIS